jgi:hypothetical protein
MTNNRTALLAVTIGSGLFILTAQESGPPGVFTTGQAEAGRVAYEATCGQCHTPTLQGRKGLGQKGDPGELPPLGSLSDSYQKFIGPRGYVPPLAGKTFMDRWGSKTAGQLISRFQETADFFLPKGTDRETTVNITAFVLQVNGAKPGNKPLTRTTDAVVRSITR